MHISRQTNQWNVLVEIVEEISAFDVIKGKEFLPNHSSSSWEGFQSFG
jgi:hypothetical protein